MSVIGIELTASSAPLKPVACMQKVKVDADIDGAKVTGEKAETVDAPIITIVAARCGPLAVAKDKGMVKEDGTIGKP